MKILIIYIFFAITIGICSCSQPFNLAKINNVSSKDILKFVYKNDKAKIHKIEILITGRINGDATIYQKDNGSFKMPIELNKGELNLRIYDDWYSPECILEYEPKNVTEGEILIKYRFYTF